MIIERLKAETRPQHDRIEEVGFYDEVMNGRLTFDEYKLMLVNNYRMHKLVEEKLEQMPEVKKLNGLDFDERKKKELLAKDLKAAGLNPKDFSTDGIQLDISDFHRAMGVYYVLEGSTLGGSVIARKLAVNENITGQGISEFNFYGCYGKMLGPRWKAFQQVLLDAATDKEAEDKMVEGAATIFAIMIDMFVTARSAAH